jgi:dCMP deaminase
MEVIMFERKDYISWDETFMALAKVIAMRSKDPSSQVGAVIVDKNNHILSLGYNGAPNGFNDEVFPWSREGEPLNTKYPFVCHAEMNAISNYVGSKEKLNGAKIYVTLFPCNECTKLIVQNGLKEIIYDCDKYKDTDQVKASKIMLDTCGVTYREYHLTKDLVINKANVISNNDNITRAKLDEFGYNMYRVVICNINSCLADLKEGKFEVNKILMCLNGIQEQIFSRNTEPEFINFYKYIDAIKHLIETINDSDTKKLVTDCLRRADILMTNELSIYEKDHKIKAFGFKLVNDHKSK